MTEFWVLSTLVNDKRAQMVYGKKRYDNLEIYWNA